MKTRIENLQIYSILEHDQYQSFGFTITITHEESTNLQRIAIVTFDGTEYVLEKSTILQSFLTLKTKFLEQPVLKIYKATQKLDNKVWPLLKWNFYKSTGFWSAINQTFGFKLCSTNLQCFGYSTTIFCFGMAWVDADYFLFLIKSTNLHGFLYSTA